MSGVYSPKAKADMKAGFPMAPPAIVGRPNAKSLFDLLLHLINCAQSHRVPGNNGLNLLHIAVQGQMYNHFLDAAAGGAQPPRAQNPGDTPTHVPGGDAGQRSNEKLTWERDMKAHVEENNMEGGLIERMLEQIPQDYKKDFLTHFARNPNMT